MKTLVNEIDGRKDFPIFKGTDFKIFEWLKKNIDCLELDESWSCEIELTESGEIFISGDGDSVTLRIIEVEVINLTI